MTRRYQHPAPSLEERIARLEDQVRWMDAWITAHNIREVMEGEE
ncbi:hypothetical protein [Microbacterium sp. SMR1]|nr:hypothetical protein [Microbacterium sp. SMR1]